MGYIKEPKGIDFVIQSRPLTTQEELEISEYIKNYKIQNKSRVIKKQIATKQTKQLI
jgi:hypothetical protein